MDILIILPNVQLYFVTGFYLGVSKLEKTTITTWFILILN